MDRTARYVVGVDFGTLSGRAVVVSVDDGTELGTAVHEYRHGVLERRLDVGGAAGPGPAAGLGAAGPPRLRRGAAAGRAGGGPRQRHRPRRRDRHRHRLHGLHGAARARRRHAAVRAARVRRPPARLRQALEAPRRTAPRRPHQRAGRPARRAVAGAVRRQDLVGVGVRQGPAAARGGPRGLPAHRPLGRGRRLDRVAAHRTSTCATPAPPATRRSTRTAPTRRRTSSAPSTRRSPTSWPTRSSARSPSSASASDR